MFSLSLSPSQVSRLFLLMWRNQKKDLLLKTLKYESILLTIIITKCSLINISKGYLNTFDRKGRCYFFTWVLWPGGIHCHSYEKTHVSLWVSSVLFYVKSFNVYPSISSKRTWCWSCMSVTCSISIFRRITLEFPAWKKLKHLRSNLYHIRF